MGPDQFPFGVDIIGADVPLVGRDADILVDTGEFTEFLKVAVHRLVGVVRECLVILERDFLVFLQNGLCDVVKFDGYTVCRLDGRDLYMVVFDIAAVLS